MLLNFNFSQGDKIYWNNQSTSVKVDVPIGADETLEGGRVQIRASFNNSDLYQDLGAPFTIEAGDLESLKEILVPREDFIILSGYGEDVSVEFIAEIWDRAGNSIIGTVSDSILTIDETVPTLLSVTIKSTNELNDSLAMPDDMVTLKLIASEGLDKPVIEINGDEQNVEGSANEWTVERVFLDGDDDGKIVFSISYKDYAQNEGEVISSTTDESVVYFDGTLPELDDISLYSNNKFDKSLAVKNDSVILEFTSSEILRDISVTINGNDVSLLNVSSLVYKYFHIFSADDSEGSVPISIEYKDMAGNQGEQIIETSDKSSVLFDNTPPDPFKVQNVGASIKKSKKVSVATNKSSSQSASVVNSFFTPTILIIISSVIGVVFILMVFSWWKIFSRSNQSGWKVLIPFFNLFVLTKILKKPVWWIVIYTLAPINHIIISLQIAKLFEKKILFAIGLILLPFIFYPILALSKPKIQEKPA